jgi:hypothetical protein
MYFSKLYIVYLLEFVCVPLLVPLLVLFLKERRFVGLRFLHLLASMLGLIPAVGENEDGGW